MTSDANAAILTRTALRSSLSRKGMVDRDRCIIAITIIYRKGQ
jgi:hypothetical protein